MSRSSSHFVQIRPQGAFTNDDPSRRNPLVRDSIALDEAADRRWTCPKYLCRLVNCEAPVKTRLASIASRQLAPDYCGAG